MQSAIHRRPVVNDPSCGSAPYEWYAIFATCLGGFIIKCHNQMVCTQLPQVQGPIYHQLSVLLIAIYKRDKNGRLGSKSLVINAGDLIYNICFADCVC